MYMCVHVLYIFVCVHICVCMYMCVYMCVCRYMRVRTQLAHSEDLTEHLGQLDAAPPERTLVLVLPAAVLKHHLHQGHQELSHT